LDFGLEQAIQSYVENALQNREEPFAHLDIETGNYQLPERVMLALYRISQHAISNVIKHADAQNLYVRLRTAKENLVLEVEDDGKGFELPRRWVELARQGHLGLVGTVERAKAIGGKLKVYSGPGKGTLIQVTLPIPDLQESANLHPIAPAK
jgi:signal transduction histidine kinase